MVRFTQGRNCQEYSIIVRNRYFRHYKVGDNIMYENSIVLMSTITFFFDWNIIPFGSNTFRNISAKATRPVQKVNHPKYCIIN